VVEWAEDDHPLPFLKHLYGLSSIHLPSIDSHYYYGLTSAYRANFIPLIRFLLEHGADEGWARTCNLALSPLSWASSKGNLAAVKLLLAQDGVDLNSGEDGRTALWFAAAGCHDALVKLLLGYDGINVNIQDNWGHTPLSVAAQNGYISVVMLLLACDNIDVNPGGLSPLHWAELGGHQAVVELLLARKDMNGRTPMP